MAQLKVRGCVDQHCAPENRRMVAAAYRGQRRGLLAAAIAIPVTAGHKSKSGRCTLQPHPLHLLQLE